MRPHSLRPSRVDGAVTGVRFDDARGTPGHLAADLVVDASGRASPTRRFLELVVFVCRRTSETSKSESNHASCDHGVTGVPRVTLVP
jgi:2-polyprenyl-6-methoxyphenol hydroxylase-like FAD-dependent oxidoreductase